MNNKIPKVFISYSWDNEPHKQWVLSLATLLRSKGIEVVLDVWELKPGKDKDFFMENSVRISDKVLLILTPNYKVKAENRKGGVGNEISMIRAEKFNYQETEKFIPIVRLGDRRDCTPLFIKSLIDIDMSIDDNFEKSFEELLRTIYDEPKHKKPHIGEKPNFKEEFYIEKNVAKPKMKEIFKQSLDSLSSNEICKIFAKFHNEGRQIIILFGSVMAGQSMFLTSLMYYAIRATTKKWNATFSDSYPFDMKSIDYMIKLMENRYVLPATDPGTLDLIGIDIEPHKKKLPVLKLAFIHTAGEHWNEFHPKRGNIELPLINLLKACEHNSTIFCIITPFQSFMGNDRENELHFYFINYLKNNMPILYKNTNFFIIVSKWDCNPKTEVSVLEKYIEQYRPSLYNLMQGKKERTMYGEYSVGNILETRDKYNDNIEIPVVNVIRLNNEYPNRFWNALYRLCTGKNLNN